MGVFALVEVDGVLRVRFDSGYTQTLERAFWNASIYFARGDSWINAICGVAEWWSGELRGSYYQGPAIVRNTSVWPTPKAEIGKWAAKANPKLGEDDNWTLEPGMLVKMIGGASYGSTS